MDRPNGQKGGPRRLSDNPDVFDDEHALDLDEDDFMPSISDGFRPMNATQDGAPARQNHDRHAPPRPQPTTAQTTDTHLRRVATRNSTAKVPIGRDSTSPDSQNPRAQLRGPSSQPTPLQYRDSVSSTASFATTTRSESGFGSGPSHPYGMYAQNTVARNSGTATTSTQRDPQRPLSIQRPAHPYGMYSQNVVEDEPPVPEVQAAIPVGFPSGNASLPTGYHRRIGPDGEEQDIVGPDGHTEQLPPYSRYPQEGPTKASMAAEASAASVEAMPNPATESDDALLTDAAPDSPVTPPMTPITPLAPVAPALLPPQRPETQTGNTAQPRPATTSESASLLTTTASDESFSEKDEPAMSLKKTGWRKKKLWGKIPAPVVLILVLLLLVFAMILGAAIGTFVAKQNKNSKDKVKNRPQHEEPAAIMSNGGNTLFDAIPVTTSVSGPPLPTGQFSLPLGFAQESSPGCLTQSNQYSAWSCKMSFAPLKLTISTSDAANATLEAFVPPDGSMQYGLQAPMLQESALQLVDDLDLRALGPAWHFSTRYDKLVVLSPEEFAAGASLRRRQDDKPFRHRFQIQPGDNPWFCFWNSTYIEGYIYIQGNSTAATKTGYPTPNPTDPFPAATAPPSSGFTGEPLPTITSAPAMKRGDDPPPFPRLPPYPRVVKIEERRLPGSPQPYCQKMQLLEDGQFAPASSSNGGTVMVWLQEQDPTLEDFFAGDGPPSSPSPLNATSRKRAAEKRRDPSDACHCQWMFS